MRLTIAKAAFAAALPLLFAAPAMAGEQHDKLMKLCTDGGQAPASCECQVKVLEENIDAKTLKVFVAMLEAENGGNAEEAEKAALAEAGITKEEFDKSIEAAMEKMTPAMEACPKA